MTPEPAFRAPPSDAGQTDLLELIAERDEQWG